jgi:hypothetical protein
MQMMALDAMEKKQFSAGSVFDSYRYTLDQHVQWIHKKEYARLTESPPWFSKVEGMDRLYTVPVMRRGMDFS